MPTVRIPLVGSFNQRGVDGSAALDLSEDQRFLNCVFSVVNNPITGKATAYVEKRPGPVLDSQPASGSASTGLSRPQSFNATISAFGNTNSTIYFGTTSVGVITGRAVSFGETIISGVSMVLIKSSDGTGWYYPNGAKDITAYTCDGNNSTTITDIKVGGVASVSGLYVGQKLTAATNIAAGSRIVSINSGAFSAVLDTATTGGAFNDLATTKEPIAKIIDADFVTTGTYVTGFVEMDGYLFYGSGGNIWNSDLNSVTSYSATAFKAADMSPDLIAAMARSKNVVLAFGTGSTQGFQNAGYATGSVLERLPQTFHKIGAQGQSSVSELEDDIYFISSSNAGDVHAMKMLDYAPVNISTPTVDKIMGTAVASGGTTYTSAFHVGGYPYFMATFSSATEGAGDKLLLESGDYLLLESGDKLLLEGDPASVASFVRQLVYNDTLKVWSEWDCELATFVIGQGAGSNNKIYMTSRFDTSGNVYRIDPSSDGNVYSDNGTSYTCQIRTSRIDHGTSKRKFVTEIRLVADTQSSGTVTLEASDDDYQSWFTIGTFDLTQMEKKITRCKSYKGGRAYRLSHTTATPFRAEALEIDVWVGEA